MLAFAAIAGAAGNTIDYGFYQLLRIAVTVAALVGALTAWRDRETGWFWLFAATAVVFNPVIPLRFEAVTWHFIDWCAAGMFLVNALVQVMKPRPGEQLPPVGTPPTI